jgi:hypothetical protein
VATKSPYVIDVTREKLLTLGQAAKFFPCKRQGKNVHCKTVLRYILRGCRGERLAAVRAGCAWATTSGAIAEFIARLTRIDSPNQPTPKHPSISDLDAELKEKGLL